MIERLPLEIFEDPDDELPANPERDDPGSSDTSLSEQAEAGSDDAAESTMCQWCGEHFDAGLDTCPGCGARAVNPEIVLREPHDVRMSRPPTNWTMAGGYVYSDDASYEAGVDLAEGLLGPFIDLFARMFDH